MKILLLVLSSLALTMAIQDYRTCLNCFDQNRTNYYYCQTNKQCLPNRSTVCPASQILFKNYQCVEGFQLCTNVTFNDLSIGYQQDFGYGLPPGQGCYIQIDRIRNGSIGTMKLNYDDPNILVFDEIVMNYQPGTPLGMPVTDYGWAPRKIFVVNRGDSPSGFTVTFQAGYMLKNTIAVLLLLMFTLF